ncbi:FAD-dependent monooxygenase [Candidatus Tisiphia endosymbiont of Ptychoptera albimana]|uniref:FAD-dependent monooxygenase n=1 Tax=Candidatus Tisiphia endosymbiont of Ptychoptera albimana TaxID=3066260 RepID=UPI001DDF2502|nr:FAD-dependent monooxygenase [Rickettsia endosymbiont of Sericostoma sp. HW-2014]
MKKEIVILGCGLSGMLTALSFAEKNIKTTILECQSINSSIVNSGELGSRNDGATPISNRRATSDDVTNFSSIDYSFCADIRTTALTPASSRFLEANNLWSEIEQVAGKMLEIYVVDNKAPEMLCLPNIKGNDALGYIVKNSEFKQILLENVKKNSLINIIDQCGYQKIDSKADHSIIYLDNQETINSDLLIVCDGHNSKARQYYFFNKIEKSYNQTALTFNIRHEKNHENCAIEHFMPSGPFAILPLKDQKTSSIVWTTSQEQAALLTSLPSEEFEYLVSRNCGNSLGAIVVDSDISSFPLKARVTSKYFHNKIVVVADSAHVIHPLAGQGLNQGIKDIETLTGLVASSGTNAVVLERYQKLRQNDNCNMYMITESLNSIFSNHSKPLWYLRRLGLKAIDNIDPIKNLLKQYAMGKRFNLY